MNPLAFYCTACRSGISCGLPGCCPLLAAAQQTRADAEKDPVLKAMLEELDRSMSQLQLKGFAKPFFIQYRIEDVRTTPPRRSLAPAKARSKLMSAWPG